MQKTEKENRSTLPPIDIPSAVIGVINGNEDATRQLDEALRQKLMPYFTARDSKRAEDLTQDTLIKISTALSDFDPNLGEGTYEQNFWGWVFTIGRNTMIDDHRREQKQQGGMINIPIREDRQYPDAKEGNEGDKGQSYQIDDRAILNLIKSRFPGLLSGAEQEIIEQRIAGKRNKEIAELLNSTEGSVKTRMTRARTKIEREILEQIGFKPAGAFRNRIPSDAIRNGGIGSIKILGRFYLREEDVRNYKGREIDQGLLDNGYVLLSQATTLSEYFHLQSGNIPLRHNGRLYIKTDVLEEFRKKDKTRKRKRVFPPSPDHKKLGLLCQTLAQYERAMKAIKANRLPAIKNRHGLFVKEEDFSAWAETLRK
ncbi:MAG: RNA polymerase sigma factor [Patescibacteria group bacterium]|nr:RNA polymerase sigma factor [Patescibacteria group bacterium]